MDELGSYLPQDILQRLTLTVIDPHAEDLPIWRLSMNGKFSSKSLLRLLHLSSNLDNVASLVYGSLLHLLD